MIALDTNIWIYSHDTRDPAKQATAQNLIAQAQPLALPWQVGCEFIAASRKLKPWGFSEQEAWQALDAMQAAAAVVLLPEAELWSETHDLLQRFTMSFWDALLVC